MAIESKNLLVAVKAFSRANPLPIDSSSVWDSKLEADTYAKAANAYAGQVTTNKNDIATLKEQVTNLQTASLTEVTLSEIEALFT